MSMDEGGGQNDLGRRSPWWGWRKEETDREMPSKNLIWIICAFRRLVGVLVRCQAPSVASLGESGAEHLVARKGRAAWPVRRVVEIS